MRAIHIAAAQASRGLGIHHGPIHAEASLNEQGVYIIEVAARTAGGPCSHTLKSGTGMSFEELGLRHATGEEINGETFLAGASGVMMLPIPCSGRLRAVSGVEEALAAPHSRGENYDSTW